MGPVRNAPHRARPDLVTRLQLRLSHGWRFDGLWIGACNGEMELLLQRVAEALALIKQHDRARYDRLPRDLDRVWIRLLPGYIACFNDTLNACELDRRFVGDAATSVEMIAATIVHEATHARLWHRGIGYEEDVRHRVEAACVRRELSFARRLPNGVDARKRAELLLSYPADTWTDEAFSECVLEGSVENFRHIGGPDWMLGPILRLRRMRLGLLRLIWELSA
jgi:hypothetical protein